MIRPDSSSQDEPGNLRKIPSEMPGRIGRIQRIIESTLFQRTVIVLISINAITLGLETSETVMASIGPQLLFFDSLVLAFFAMELIAK